MTIYFFNTTPREALKPDKKTRRYVIFMGGRLAGRNTLAKQIDEWQQKQQGATK